MALRGEPGDYDEHEPLELEGLRVSASDVAELAGVPLAATDCVFASCDLSALRFYGVKNSRFESSKLRGTVFSKHVRNTVFQDCQLAESTFRMMILEKIVFERSMMIDCDFYGSELTDLAFPGTQFEGVGFDACTLDGVNLCDATQLLIGDPRTLKGASLCETQVPLIAHRLAQLSGIDVQDC